MILCVGEILADMIGSATDSGMRYDRKAGGAPFNVACAAKAFGAKAGFVGSVGVDTVGDYLIDYARAKSLDLTLIKRDENRNTTLAFVDLDANGERSFCFYRKNTADIYLPEIADETLAAAEIVHIGSLMLSDDVGLDYAVELGVRAKKQGCTVSFDINYRTDIFVNAEDALARYKKVIALADLVKFSEDEVAVFTEDYINGSLADKLVCITLGGNGSEWRYKGKRKAVGSIKVKPVDTTGAGDAFYGGVLANICGRTAEITDDVLDEALRFGNIAGALNTLGRGAIDCLPTVKTIRSNM